MLHDDDLSEEPNFWPSISDMFLVLFIIALACAGYIFHDNLLLKEEIVQIEDNRDQYELYVSEFQELKKQISQQQKDLQKQDAEILDKDNKLEKVNQIIDAYKIKITQLNETITLKDKELLKLLELEQIVGIHPTLDIDLESRIDHIKKTISQITDKSRVLKVVIDETKVRFASSSDLIPPHVNVGEIFADLKNELLKDSSKKFIVEIFGHTDTKKPAGLGLKDGVAYNNDLGMRRAQSIAKALKSTLGIDGMGRVKIRVYSAGEFTKPELDDKLLSDSDCRRIEVLMRVDAQ